MPALTDRFTVPDHAVVRHLDDEVVILDLSSETYFTLDKVGSLIWAMLSRGAAVGEIREAVVARYAVDRATAAADIDALIADLVGRNLLEPA